LFGTATLPGNKENDQSGDNNVDRCGDIA